MEKEIWKCVENYEGCYEVSTFGRIKSLTRYVPHSTLGSKLVTGRILSQGTTKKWVLTCKPLQR